MKQEQEENNNNFKKTWHRKHHDSLTHGEKMADGTAKFIGSWSFITTQTIIIIVWITLNLIGLISHWDPFPFILLNLIFSTQAAYAAPIIMMSQNRQSERDRQQALDDYETNLKAKVEIEKLQLDLSRIEIEKLDKILEILKENKK